MGKMTSVQRSGRIAKEQDTIKQAWTSIVSNIARETELAKQFAAWKNDSFLTNDDDFDQEDMDTINAQFLVIYSALTDSVSLLQEMLEIPDADVTVFKANNDAFIAKYSISVEDFDKRYQS